MEEITKEEIKKLMEMPGKVRGTSFRTASQYILEKEGKEGLKRLEKEMENLGHPLDFSKVKNLEWYPVGLRALVFILLRKVFNWQDKDMIEMGSASPKFSFIVKITLKYLISPRKVFELASKHWRQHWTGGVLEQAEWHEKWCILRLKDFKFHPDYCLFLCGYFPRMGQLGGGKNVTCEETKCIHKGDPYHEFLIKWE